MNTRNSVARPRKSGGRKTEINWLHAAESIINNIGRLSTKRHAGTIMSTRSKYVRPRKSGGRTIKTEYRRGTKSIESNIERLVTKDRAGTIGSTRNSVARPIKSGGRTTPTKWRRPIESAVRSCPGRVPRRIQHATVGCAFPAGGRACRGNRNGAHD